MQLRAVRYRKEGCSHPTRDNRRETFQPVLDHGDGDINIWLCDKLHVTTCEHTAREETCMGHDPNVNFLVVVLY